MANCETLAEKSYVAIYNDDLPGAAANDDWAAEFIQALKRPKISAQDMRQFIRLQARYGVPIGRTLYELQLSSRGVRPIDRGKLRAA